MTNGSFFLLAIVLSVSGLLLITLTVPRLAFTIGLLLPIWSVGSIPPVAFDALRLFLLVILSLRISRSTFEDDKTPIVSRPYTTDAKLTLFCLLLSGLLVFIRGLSIGSLDQVRMAATMLFALILISIMMKKLGSYHQIINGYICGVTLSGIVIFMGFFGISILTPQRDPGLYRATGLAPSSTLVAYQLACAIILIAWNIRSSNSRYIYYPSLVICGVAILATGGRGGLIALSVAAILAVFTGAIPIRQASLIVMVVWAGALFMTRQGVALNTVLRFTESTPGRGDISAGRQSLLSGALDDLLAKPVLGTGLAPFMDKYGVTPHFALLTFAIAGGIFAGLAILLVLGLWTVRAIGIPRTKGPTAALSTVFLVWSFLEPVGPMIGSEGLTLIIISAMLRSHEQDALMIGSRPGRYGPSGFRGI